MTRSHSEELKPYDPEIERTFHQRKNATERGENSRETDSEEQLVIFEPIMEIMGVVERPMMEYSFPTTDGTISSIVKPSVKANNFEIKPSIIQIIRSSVQFYDLADEDPNKHLLNFLEICDTFRFNGVSNDAVRLRIFSFSLCDTAKDWLQSLLASSITTWAALTQKFLAKYFPPAKTAKMLNDITSFVQLDRESLYDAWNDSKVYLESALIMSYPCGDRSNFNPYSNTYNPGWRSHQNFSWSNNQHQGPAGPHQPRQPHPQEQKSNLEEMLSKFITTTDTRFQNQDAQLQSQEASIRNIEVQIGQLVSIVSERKEGQLPSDTEKNPREQVNAIFVRNERAIGDEPPNEQVEEAQAQKEEESQEKTKGSPLKLNLDAILHISHIPKEF
ncbi:UNVERIFIED_CONTAM: hypothetical protein Slati_2397200 [Sesamum latifolium]|uniref:Retrotransposon gag domain-containing protein n=1 Tax=Sesamum latifolium TaxID=2727402 RepID=A0AAW2WFL7_9LAMI